MDYKSFPIEVTKVDAELGIITAIVAVMGNIDHGDDVIHSGAFTKTLNERGSKIKVLDNHNTHSTKDVIGKPISVREITKDYLPQTIKSKYPDATGGLETVTQFDMKDTEAAKIFNKLADGYITEWSIGFTIPKGKSTRTNKVIDGVNKVIRDIYEIILYEYSPVIWGMNEATMVVSSKNFTLLNDEKQRSLLQTYFDVVEAFEQQYFDRENYAGYYAVDVFEDNTMICHGCNIETEYPYYQLRWYHPDESTYTFSDMNEWSGGNFTFVQGVKESNIVLEEKQGRVLSQSNYDKIKSCCDILNDVINSAAPSTEDMPMMDDDKHVEPLADTVTNPITNERDEKLAEIENFIKSLGV